MVNLNNKLDNSSHIVRVIISENHMNTIVLVNAVILCGVISLLGSVANVINMIVYYKQGLDTTINISFFSLAVSDLLNLMLQQLFNVFINPLFVNLNLPIVYTDIQFLITSVPREMFARITSQITAFITAERCLCVVYPLHVKRIVTPRRTTIIVIVIYTFTLTSPLPIYFTSYYAWRFYPDLNRTLLVMAFTSYHYITEPVVYFTHALFTMLGFTSVVTFTFILIYKLGQKNMWRQTANVDQEKAKSMSKRDRATISMVVVIAGILVVCYTPAVLLGLATFLEPEFSMSGRHYTFYFSLWTFATLFENINSSVNIFLYYKMSSKYRQKFRELFQNVPLCVLILE